MNIRILRRIPLGLFLGGILLLALSTFLLHSTVQTVVATLGAFGLLGALPLFLLWYRCPHCHRMFPLFRPPVHLDYCPKCHHLLHGFRRTPKSR